MEEFLSILNKIGGASFASLLAAILYGSWKQVWSWTRELREERARHLEELTQLKQDRDWWKQMALKAMGVAELQGTVMRIKAQQQDPPVKEQS